MYSAHLTRALAALLIVASTCGAGSCAVEEGEYLVGPYWLRERKEHTTAGANVTYSKQGLYAKVVATDRALYLDGHVMCSSSSANDLHFFAQTVIPRLLREDAADVFILGYGCGISVMYLQQLGLSIEVAELEPDVIEAARGLPYHDVDLGSAGLRILYDDARSVLAYGGRKYDYIVSDPPHQESAYSTNVSSVEFFEIAQRSLTPGGSFNTWFHNSGVEDLIAFYKTMKAVFREAYVIRIHGQFILLGLDSELTAEQIARIAGLRFESLIGNQPHVLGDLPDRAFALYDCNEPIERTDVEVNTDDNLLIELRSGRRFYHEVDQRKLAEEAYRFLERECRQLI